MSITYATIARDALLELQIVAAGEVPSPEDQSFAEGKLARLLDNWNAEGRAIYCELTITNVCTPSLNPHTIGIAANSPTWTVTGLRPERILWANWVQNEIRTPLFVTDDKDAYMRLAAPEIESIPSGLYYERAWPNGRIYFYPVTQAAYTIEMAIYTVLSSDFDPTDEFSLPPGYRDAITLTLAEDCATAFASGAGLTPVLPRKAAEARARVFNANMVIPAIATRDAGMPGRDRGAYFDWRTGLWNGSRY